MIEISKDEAQLAMEALVEGRKNLREQADDVEKEARVIVGRPVPGEASPSEEENARVERLLKLAKERRKRADEMNELLNSLADRARKDA